MNGKPPLLILLGLKKELRELRGVMTEIEAPTLDEDALCDMVFDAIKTKEGSERLVELMAFEMAERDLLFENLDLDYETSRRISGAVTRFSNQIKNNLDSLELYANGHLNYKFRKLHDKNTVEIILNENNHP